MNIVTRLLAGIVFLATFIFVGIALWMGFTQYPTVMLSLVAIITVTRAYGVHAERPSQTFRHKWIIFWYENQWLKLVLLFIVLWMIRTFLVL